MTVVTGNEEGDMTFTDAEIDAAARVLDAVGRKHGWWDARTPKYDDLDPIGKSEFGGIIEAMLRAAADARG